MLSATNYFMEATCSATPKAQTQTFQDLNVLILENCGCVTTGEPCNLPLGLLIHKPVITHEMGMSDCCFAHSKPMEASLMIMRFIMNCIGYRVEFIKIS